MRIAGTRRVHTSRHALIGKATLIEGLETRILMTVNAWKAGVSGNWNDPAKWSLGHFPTTAEDVTITAAGSYTVTVPTVVTTPYFYCNSIVVGGSASGAQKLAVNAYMIINKAFSVGAGDSIDIGAGRFNASTPAGTNCQIDGTITLNGVSGKTSYLTTGAGNLNGAGSIVFATGGANSLGVNLMTSNGSVLGAGITLRGKGGTIQGTFTNKGTMKLEGGATDLWSISGLTNQGSLTSPGGSNITIYNLVNAAGHSLSVTGGFLALKGTYSNAGTITASNTKITYGMTFSAAGTVNRTNSPVYFSGVLNAAGGVLKTGDAAGQWIWTTGKLQNGSYDAGALTALKIDKTAPSGGYGLLDNVTLTGDLAIPGGFYVNAINVLSISAGHKIILNGTTATGRAALYVLSTTLTGGGEVLFNTAGNNLANNLLSGNAWTLGGGVVVHGKAGQIEGLTNSGVILADNPGETIQINSVINNGNIISAPGVIRIQRFTQNAGGALTVGIGGTSPGSGYGQFVFFDAVNAPALNGTFNAVTLSGFAPAVGGAFNVATFAKAPTGAFATKNVDAGSGKAFDLAQTTAAISLKGKNVAGAFAARTAAGAMTITGTAAADTIATKQLLGVLYATMTGKTSVFFDRQIISETVNAGAGADSVSVNGPRAVTLAGGDGNDSLTGGSGADRIDGGEGSDLLSGGGGDDTYVFTAALLAQVDTIAETSGNGSDTLDFSALTTAVTVNLTSDAALATMANRTVKTQAAGQAANIENAIGGAANDSLTGNAAANRFVGGAGNDVIDGAAGNDLLFGGIGNDKITGGAGLDSMYGEAGNDSLFGADGGAKDLLDGGADADVKGSADAVDTIVSIP
ncbi:MAG TPA: hypothetical protein VLI90_01185 [Tepidisphaeraceae bacterium]|nr:hypothetical protein [Tepidisphaeraceae bacterium]